MWAGEWVPQKGFSDAQSCCSPAILGVGFKPLLSKSSHVPNALLKDLNQVIAACGPSPEYISLIRAKQFYSALFTM